MIIKNGEVFQEDGSFRLQDLYVENHRIVASEDEVTDKTIVDAAGLRVIPGLGDIHSHGAFGHDFSDADPEGLKIILKYEKSHGITSYCPTSMTLPAEELKEIFATIKTVGEMKAGATVRGINMEGPFLDAKKKGAHVEGYIRKPDAGFCLQLLHIRPAVGSKNKGHLKILTLSQQIFRIAFSHSARIILALVADDAGNIRVPLFRLDKANKLLADKERVIGVALFLIARNLVRRLSLIHI